MKLRDQADQIRTKLVEVGAFPNSVSVAKTVRDEFPLVGSKEHLKIYEEVVTTIAGLGPLENLSKQEGITDILVNGPKDVWFVDAAGMHKAEICWESETELRDFAGHLALQSSRRLDDSQPFLDVQIANTIRIHAVIPPLSNCGTCLSIRIAQPQLTKLSDLYERQMFGEQALITLKELVTSGASFMISGGTGSGKTTLLGALLAEVNPLERVVAIEDTKELSVDHPHFVSLQSRSSNSEGAGLVTLRDLVRQSLRMRPDRLILGEVRGLEIIDLVTALNTGHSGGCATIHANSASDVPTRIVSLGLLAGIPVQAMHQLFASAITVVIELKQLADGLRKISSLNLVELREGVADITPVFNWLDGIQFDEGLRKYREVVSRNAI